MISVLLLVSTFEAVGQELDLSETHTNVNCKSYNTGTIQLTATGGQSPYIYYLNNAETTQNIEGLAAGTYNVSVKDALNITKSLTVTITEPEFPLFVDGVVTHVLCYGTNTGSISLNIQGGTQPYLVTWSNGSHDLILNNILKGTYNVSITDINGCLASAEYVVSEPQQLNPGIINTDVSKFCYGGRDPIGGTNFPNAPASGGIAPYTYLWQLSEGCSGTWTNIDGTNNTSYTPVSPATTTCYRRMVIDSNGCIDYTGVKKFEMYPDLVSQTIVGSPATATICSGTNVSATFIDGSGGFEGGYKDVYEYSTDGGSNWSTYISGQQISTSGLSGNSIIKITTRRMPIGVAGCNWGDPKTLSWTVNSIPSAPTAESNSPVCAGSSLNLTASTITGATYSWTGPNGFTSTLQNPTVSNATTAATGTYSVTATVNGCTSDAGTVAAIVNAIPSAPTAGSNSPVCAGSTLNLTASTIIGATYSWTGPNGFTSTLQNPTVSNATTAASGTYSVTATVNGCTSNSGTVEFVVNPLLSNNNITASQSICSGTAPSTLNGSTPSGGDGIYAYSWESSTTGATSGFVAIAATNSISYSPGILTQTTWFRRIVSSGGCNSISESVQITVNPVLSNNTITAAQSICTGTIPATLVGSTPSGGSGAYIYSWESSTTGAVSGFVAIAATNSINYSPGTLTQTTWFRRTVNSGGCNIMSESVQITVNPVLSNNTISASQSICTGTAPATLNGSTPSGGSGTYIYSWESSTAGATNGFVPITGTNAINYSPGTLTQTTWFRRTVSSGGCNSTSSAVQVTVNPIITNNSIVSSSPICTGSTSTLSGSAPVGGNGTYTYLWESNTTGGTVFSPAGGTNNGANYTLGTLSQTTWFRRTVTSGGCSNNSTPVQVNITPVIPNQTTALCSESSLSLTFTTNLPGRIVPTGTTYTWTVLNASPGITGATAQSNPQPAITQTLTNTSNFAQTVTYSVIPTGGTGCVGNAFQLTVTVNPKPNIPAQAVTICSGTSPDFVPVNNLPSTVVPSGTLYTWTVSGPNSNITGASAQTSSRASINQILTNNTTTTQSVTYTVTPVGPNCTGNSFPLVVTVSPKPSVNTITPASICSGNSLTTNFSGNVSGATFSWSRPVVGGISNEPAAGTTSGTITETLINTTLDNKIVTYSITPIYNGCPGNVYNYQVTVKPAANISGPLSLYEGTTVTYTTEPGRTSYNWSVSSGGTIVSGQNTDQIQVSWNTSGPQTVTMNGSALNECSGLKTINVTVYSAPTVSFDIVKSGSFPVNPAPGDEVSYNITYKNTSSTTATNVVITDYLPPSTLFTYESSDNGGVYNSGSNTVVWNIANVPPDGSGYVTVTGVIGRLGSAFSYNPSSYYISNSSSETTLTNRANIRSEQSPVGYNTQHVSGPVSQKCGSQFTGGSNDLRQGVDKVIYYPLTIINTGNVFDNFTFSVPASITVPTGGTIRLSIVDINKNPLPLNQSGWIPPNGSFTFLLAIDGTQATKPKDNDIFNIVVTSLSAVCNSTSTATVKTTTYNGNPGNQQDIQITKTASVGSYTVGSGSITYTIVMTNVGQSDATNVTLTDVLPTNAPIPTLADITSDSGTPVISGNTITWSGLNVNIGDIFRYTVKVTPTCTSVPVVVNSATATLSTDRNFNNNSSSVSVNIIPSAVPPVISTTTPVICSNSVASLSATGATGGEIYRWYTSLNASEEPFTTGSSVTTFPLTTNATFYASIYDPASGCESSRASISIVVSADVTTPVFQLGATSSRCQAAQIITYSATAQNSTGITYELDAASLAAGNTINSSNGDVSWVSGWSGTSVITATAAGCHPKTATHTVITRALPGTSAIYHN